MTMLIPPIGTSNFLAEIARLLPAVHSWHPLIAQPDSLLGAIWNPKKAQWWAWSPSVNDTIALSDDAGAFWRTQNPGTSGVKYQAMAIDGAGNMIAVGASNTIAVYTDATNAWAQPAPFTLASQSHADVAYESTGALFAAYGTTEIAGWTGGQLVTSTSGAVWTDQSAHLPAIFIAGDGVNGAQARYVSAGSGHVVVALMLVGVVHLTSAASSAANVWSGAVTIVPTMSSPTSCTKPVYSPDLGAWFVCVTGTNAGKACSEIWWTSDPPGAWSQRAVLGGTTQTITIAALVALGPLLVGIMGAGFEGITNKGALAYSADGGKTWSPSTRVGASDATAWALAAGDGGLLALDSGGATKNTQASIRVGRGGIAGINVYLPALTT